MTRAVGKGPVAIMGCSTYRQTPLDHRQMYTIARPYAWVLDLAWHILYREIVIMQGEVARQS